MPMMAPMHRPHDMAMFVSDMVITMIIITIITIITTTTAAASRNWGTPSSSRS